MMMKLATWESNDSQIINIKPSDGCGRKTITTTTQLGYDHNESSATWEIVVKG
jgi:hypothetical protein